MELIGPAPPHSQGLQRWEAAGLGPLAAGQGPIDADFQRDFAQRGQSRPARRQAGARRKRRLHHLPALCSVDKIGLPVRHWHARLGGRCTAASLRTAASHSPPSFVLYCPRPATATHSVSSPCRAAMAPSPSC